MKIKILGVILAVFCVIIGIGGYFMYQKSSEDKMIKKEIESISKMEEKFAKTENHQKKLDVLKSTMRKYEKSEKHFPEVTKKYDSAITWMQEKFIKEYDTKIKENTLKNLENMDDIEIINQKKVNLTDLLAQINNEYKYTLPSNHKYENYKTKISKMTNTYENQIATLEEAKKKEEEEAKKKEEEETKKKVDVANTHYENEYFTVDVPEEWVGHWSIKVGENTLQNSSAIAVYDAEWNPDEEDSGGCAQIYVLKFNPETDKVGYGNFSLPAGGEYVEKDDTFPEDNIFVIIMSQAGAGFFFDGGATITRK